MNSGGSHHSFHSPLGGVSSVNQQHSPGGRSISSMGSINTSNPASNSPIFAQAVPITTAGQDQIYSNLTEPNFSDGSMEIGGSFFSQLDSMMEAVKVESSALDSMKERLQEVDTLRVQIGNFSKRLLDADQANLNLKNSCMKLQDALNDTKKSKEEVESKMVPLRQELTRVKDVCGRERNARMSAQQENAMLKEQITRLEQANESMSRELKAIPALNESNEIMKMEITQLRRRYKEEKLSASRQIKSMETRARNVEEIKGNVRNLAMQLLELSSNGPNTKGNFSSSSNGIIGATGMGGGASLRSVSENIVYGAEGGGIKLSTGNSSGGGGGGRKKQSAGYGSPQQVPHQLSSSQAQKQRQQQQQQQQQRQSVLYDEDVHLDLDIHQNRHPPKYSATNTTVRARRDNDDDDDEEDAGMDHDDEVDDDSFYDEDEGVGGDDDGDDDLDSNTGAGEEIEDDFEMDDHQSPGSLTVLRGEGKKGGVKGGAKGGHSKQRAAGASNTSSHSVLDSSLSDEDPDYLADSVETGVSSSGSLRRSQHQHKQQQPQLQQQKQHGSVGARVATGAGAARQQQQQKKKKKMQRVVTHSNSGKLQGGSGTGGCGGVGSSYSSLPNIG